MLSCYKSVKRGEGEIGMYSYKNQVKNSGKYIKGRPECPSQYINAVFVGDRSGSMYSMGSVPQEGAVQFMNKYKELAKKYEDALQIIVTIYTFDDEVEIPFSGNALWLVSSEQMYSEKVYSSMIPRGSTKLFDTAIQAIKKQQKDLDEYLKRIEEAEKRDHRKLGKEMDLFHFREESPGSVFWHERGWSLFQKLVDYMRYRQKKAGYKEINTPEILDRSLWEKSGHWEKFGEHMYTSTTPDEKIFAIKPMNCPGCVQVFNQGLKSYRDLPLKMSEFGKVHRYEPSGALHGLMRVRAFTQDDAHIFCTEDQITSESLTVTNLILNIYKDLGFSNVILKYSDRPEVRVGEDVVWDKSEAALLEAVKATKLEYSINKGEGAFYGPKIEFVLRDAIGRDWQCGTLQVDLNLPERLGATYVDKDGSKKVPVMLHRALFGSLERFIGILIENYAGKLPFWISPLQVVVIPVSDDFDDYAKKVSEKINNSDINSIVDLKNHNLNYKIREHSLSKIPVLLICGKKEVDSNSVTIRKLDNNKQETMKLDKFIDQYTALNRAPTN